MTSYSVVVTRAGLASVLLAGVEPTVLRCMSVLSLLSLRVVFCDGQCQREAKCVPDIRKGRAALTAWDGNDV